MRMYWLLICLYTLITYCYRKFRFNKKPKTKRTFKKVLNIDHIKKKKPPITAQTPKPSIRSESKTRTKAEIVNL